MEAELLRQVIAATAEPDSPLDWVDAALLSYRLGQQIESEIEVLG